jgi:hypothetical protein
VRAAAAGIAVAALVLAPPARAYCRATTCADGARCDPATPADCGEPLRWDRPCIGVSVQEDGSSQIGAEAARDLLLEAFAAWEGADCGDTRPGVHVEDLGFVACDAVEYNGSSGNANVLVFRDGAWPHPSGLHNIALTTVTFDAESGVIYDADIEINSGAYPLTVGPVTSDYDLPSVLTHEAGHFLGLAHSGAPEATMNAVYPEGTTDFRTLAPDDALAICVAYPPADAPGRCDPIPRHGFSPACAADQTEGDCAVRPPARAPSARALAVLAAAALAALTARRARRG